MIKAVGDYLIMEAVETKMIGDLMIPKDSEGTVLKAKVLSVGEDVVKVEEGDIVYYNKHTGYRLDTVEGTKRKALIVIRQTNAIGVEKD